MITPSKTPRIKARRFIVLLSMACVCMYTAQPLAYSHKKSRVVCPRDGASLGRPTPQQLRSFEQQLTPFFNEKHERNRRHDRPLQTAVRPAQEDFFNIARYWNLLSPQFKATYLHGSEIPLNMTWYISPRGLFEVYYDTSGVDSVDRTDAYGYGPANWRSVSPLPNGVPDYIDEVAWAFDSAWSMEIDHYQFVRPNPLINTSYPSQRYKVIVRQMDVLYSDGYYGLTTPVGLAGGNAMGQQSYIELRNEWSNPAWWSGDTTLHTDYLHHPQWGARVTAVHEFFHAIQFAMTRSKTGLSEAFLDDFPDTWLEGSGVLMEQTGFADIKDYLQYVGSYFDDPTLDLFSGYGDVYTTSLLALYLYNHAKSSPDIAFVKNIFFNNYNAPAGFHDNLARSSIQCGSTWPQLLGDFHTASYFSDQRTGPVPFLPDAGLMPQWAIAGETLDPGYAVHKTVSAYAMEPVLYQRGSNDADSLLIEFLGDSQPDNQAAANPLWSIHGIVQSVGGAGDSVFEFPVLNSGHGTMTINHWQQYGGVVLIASNALGDGNHAAAFIFNPCPIQIKRGDSALAIGVISSPLSSTSSIQALAIAHQDLACTLSITQVAATAQQSDSARKNRLVPINGFSMLGFPLFWAATSSVTLMMREDTAACLSLEYKYRTTAAAFSIYQWNGNSASWNPVGNRALSGSVYQWRHTQCTPGIYGLFCHAAIPLDSGSEKIISLFPNPVHLKSQSAVKIDGTALLRLLVYDVRGNLVYRRESATPVLSMTWPVTAGACAPGMYYAVIGYKDGVTKGLTQKKQKVMVVP